MRAGWPDQTTDLGSASTVFLVFGIIALHCSSAAHTVNRPVLAAIKLDAEADPAREQDDEKRAAHRNPGDQVAGLW